MECRVEKTNDKDQALCLLPFIKDTFSINCRFIANKKTSMEMIGIVGCSVHI